VTPESFTAWRIRHYGLRGVKAASDALGCSRTSIKAWERGYVDEYTDPKSWRADDAQPRRKHREIPRYIALACQALVNGLQPAE
jgi:hypothetical protein